MDIFKSKEKLFISSDHAGFELKEALTKSLIKEGMNVEDLGPHEFNPSDDYPDFVAPLAQAIGNDPEHSRGIIIGGSGQGEAMCANRFSGARTAVYYGGDYQIIKLSREHNNSNILSTKSSLSTLPALL